MTRVCMDLVLFDTEFSTHGPKLPPTQLLRAGPRGFVRSGARGRRVTGAPRVMDSREPQVVSWCLKPRQEGLSLALARRFVSVDFSLDARRRPSLGFAHDSSGLLVRPPDCCPPVPAWTIMCTQYDLSLGAMGL